MELLRTAPDIHMTIITKNGIKSRIWCSCLSCKKKLPMTNMPSKKATVRDEYIFKPK